MMAAAVTVLGWGAYEFKDAYMAAGEHGRFLSSITAPLEYLRHVYNATTERLIHKVRVMLRRVLRVLCCSMCLFLKAPFCHRALKLDLSIIFTTCFLLTSLQFILYSYI